jgi:hypothetical protein
MLLADLSDLGARRAQRVKQLRPTKRGVQSRGDSTPKIDKEFIEGAVNDLEKLRILAGLAKAARLTNEHGITEYHNSGVARHATEMNPAQFAEFKRANQFIKDFISKGMELSKLKGVPNQSLSEEDRAEKQQTIDTFTTNVLANMSASSLSGERYLNAKAVADLIIKQEVKANAKIQDGLNKGLSILHKKVSQGANDAVAELVGAFANVGAIEGISAAPAVAYQAVMSIPGGMPGPFLEDDEPKRFFTYANSLRVIPPNMDVNNPNDVIKYGSASIAILAFPYLIDALDANADKLLSKIQDKDLKKIASLYIKSFANAIEADRTGDVGGILARRAKALNAEINQTFGKKALDSYTNSIKREIQNIKFARSQSEIDEYMANINALAFQIKQSGGEVPGELIAQANESVRLQKDRITKQATAGPSWQTESDPAIRQRKMELTSLLTSINSDLIALESRVQTYKSSGGAAPDFSQIGYKMQQANKIASEIGRGLDSFDKSSLADAKRRLSNMSNIVSTYSPIGGGGPGVSTGGNNQPQNPYNYYPSSGGEMGPFPITQPPTQPNYTIAGLGNFTSGVPTWLKVAAAVVGSWMIYRALNKR